MIVCKRWWVACRSFFYFYFNFFMQWVVGQAGDGRGDSGGYRVDSIGSRNGLPDLYNINAIYTR